MRWRETVVFDLFHAWVKNPRLLPEGYVHQIEGLGGQERAARVVSDYLAGMTDGFILQQYRKWDSL